MFNTASVLEAPAAQQPLKVLRLHHNAYVVRDQAATNDFCERILDFSLVQFWIEDTQLEGKPIVLSHAFYGLEDGSALCFCCMSISELHKQLNRLRQNAIKLRQAASDCNLVIVEGFDGEHPFF